MLLTTTDIKTYIGKPNITNDEATTIYNQAYSIITSLCNVESFEDELVTDRFDYNGNGPYYLKSLPRRDAVANTTIHAINGTEVDYTTDVDYLMNGRKLIFSSSVTIQAKNTSFNFVDITYHSGFNGDVPGDFSGALLALCKFVDNKTKTQGINSYTQGDISVEYSSNGSGLDTNEVSVINAVVGKYKFIDVFSV